MAMHNGHKVWTEFQCSLSRDYGLPTRTLEDWSANRRTPPAWQLPLVAYAVLSDYLAARR